MSYDTLKHLCSIHSTPGDEDAIFDSLQKTWLGQNLDVRRLGAYAIYAQSGNHKKSDTLLLLAHADSPGFIVSSITSETELEVLTLGGITPEDNAKLLLKSSPNQFTEATLLPLEDPDQWTRAQPLKVRLDKPCANVQKGDRLCWMPQWQEEAGFVHSPFLDNRIACAMVADWFATASERLPEVNVVLCATAMEEVNGFGANVLANALDADAAIVLDVTYENSKQGVKMGQGPVITLSDNSILLSPAMRDKLLQEAPCALQTEVYNYSGTDAKAFPVQGKPLPVIPLLLATAGNHSSRESISCADLDTWADAICALARTLFKA